ncbi:MAG: SUMF1/EgtB/PvdO family nonheme iron enzyme [Desulfobacteraceae bacterium]|nr:SUMF1/EgtB/PvdO family nonheme iron enzyme [Desulfobacteraceae bacterium]
MALTQGKKILLIGGRETCGNCQYMKYTACESISPPIKSLIEQSFIPWFCDVDNSDEWHAYASGSGSYTLPLICVIDPENGDAHQDRTTGIQDIQDFYTRLFQMKGDAGTAYETKILTEASPDITLPTGGTSRVYGSSSVNHVTIESGANATLVNFPGSNTIIIEADSNLFSVYRSGATVIFEGTDGTKLTMPASTTAQTIIFNNKSFKLKINSVSIMLGDQLIDTTSSSIIIENNSLTQTQVSQLYIPIFGRASEGEGNEYWRTECTDMVTLATEMLNSPVASNYFGSMLDDNQSFVECVYFTIVSKTYEDDRDGIDYWVAELNARKTKGEVVVALIDAIRDPANAGDAQDCFNNKVTVSNYCADTIASFTDTATFCYFIDDVTADPASVSAAKNKIDTYATSISSNYTTNSLGMTFVSIHPGTFMMGSIEDELGREGYGADETQHQVTLTSAYYLQTTEVTQGQWQAIMGSNPSTHSTSGENYPVETVTWNQAQEFISKLNQRGEGIYALPTEAQWEYAARAGTSTPFHTGGCLLTDQANIGGPFPYGECPTRDGIYDLMPVASFPPNAWGLYDMHGNVSEWCQDVYGQYPSDAVGDPIGPGEGPSRVVRGGSWVDTPDSCRSAYRNYSYPCSTCFVFGLRLTYSPDPQ